MSLFHGTRSELCHGLTVIICQTLRIETEAKSLPKSLAMLTIRSTAESVMCCCVLSGVQRNHSKAPSKENPGQISTTLLSINILFIEN